MSHIENPPSSLLKTAPSIFLNSNLISISRSENFPSPFEIVTNTLVMSNVPDPDINVAISFLISSMFKSGKSFFFCKCNAEIKVTSELNQEYEDLDPPSRTL